MDRLDVDATGLLLQITGCVGFVIVVSMGKITAPVRRIWPSMMSCPMCFGIWAGCAWGVMMVLRAMITLPAWVVLAHDVIAFACTVSLLGFGVALFDHAVGGLGSIKALCKRRSSLLRRRRW